MSDYSIRELADREGGQAAFARRIEAPPAFVWQWCEGKRPISPKFARKIEEVFGVSRHELRPDVFGPAEGVANG